MKKILFLLLLPVFAFADPFIVQDNTNTLTLDQINTLILKLKDIRVTKNIVMSVQIIPTTGEQTIFDYSQHLFDELQLGNKDSDNGLLFVIAKNDRKMRIHVGYGLENTITDAFSKRVLTNITQKYFKNNNFYNGIDLTIDEIITQVSKEPIYAPQQFVSTNNSHNLIIVLSIMLLTFIVGMVIYLIYRYLKELHLYPTNDEIRWGSGSTSNTNYTYNTPTKHVTTLPSSSSDSPKSSSSSDSSWSSSSSDSSWSSNDTGGSSSGAGSDSSW